MSGRSARARRRAGDGGQLLVSTAMIPPPAAEPPRPAPETIRTVIDAVGALETMGDAAFEKLLAGYAEVVAAKGATVAYAWLAFNLDRHAGPGAVRAIAAAGVLRAHAATVPDPAKAARVEWLRWAIEKMAVRYATAYVDLSRSLAPESRVVRRRGALDRLAAALAREAS